MCISQSSATSTLLVEIAMAAPVGVRRESGRLELYPFIPLCSLDVTLLYCVRGSNGMTRSHTLFFNLSDFDRMVSVDWGLFCFVVLCMM